MKHYRLIVLMLGIIAHFSAYAQDYDLEIDGIYYTYDTDAGTATVVYMPYYEGEITIPAKITKGRYTFNVVAIAKGAFNNTKVVKVTILSDGDYGVKSIGEFAFAGTSRLRQVTLPATLESIGKLEFRKSGIQSIVIPSKLKSIPEYAFYGCSDLESVTFPETMPAGAIGKNAFYGCGLTKVSLPKGIQIGGEGAFMKCTNLKEVVLPDDFIGVNLSMFSGCSSLETIHFPQSLKYISSDAFSYCSIKSLTIPKSAEGISWDAFYSCKQLEGIIIEDSSTPLICYFDLTANSAPALKSFYLGRDITNDATADFSTNITSLTIGPSVTAVPYSFGDKLQEIICKIKNPTNVTERFSKTTKANAILKVPEGTQELYENADGWKGFFNIETFKDDGSTSIRTIDGYRCDDTWYNLNGQRTAPPLSKGMFIKNGKKVIVK